MKNIIRAFVVVLVLRQDDCRFGSVECYAGSELRPQRRSRLRA
jgi:hypothetical protein